MLIYPAMDLMDGRCVRLSKGRFDDPTVYAPDPADALAAFAADGAAWTHVVDLDGARKGSARQHELIGELARNAQLKIQVAGGFRDHREITRMFDAGVSRVVIGSLTVSNPPVVRQFIRKFGADRIALAIDVNLLLGVPMVAIHGWSVRTPRTLWQIAERFSEIRHLIITDIDRDGMMGGPNLALTADAVERLPGVSVLASGGVSSLNDLRNLFAAGAAGVIVGKALWEGQIDLKEAIGIARA